MNFIKKMLNLRLTKIGAQNPKFSSLTNLYCAINKGEITGVKINKKYIKALKVATKYAVTLYASQCQISDIQLSEIANRFLSTNFNDSPNPELELFKIIREVGNVSLEYNSHSTSINNTESINTI